MNTNETLPKLYQELADWWPLLSSPEEYEEEARFYKRTLLSACKLIPKTLLELGSGGGNNASHLKKHFQVTLVDVSPAMLKVSQELNPECEHIQGDMRNVRLGRQFDAVFIHDAIDYMHSEVDLAQVIETAFTHCRPAAAALFAPDHTRETFKPSTSHGGHDRGDRGLRYLEWTWDPDNADTTYVAYMVYLLREGAVQIRSVFECHTRGLFGHEDWLRVIARAGFEAQSLPFEHTEIEPGSAHVFLGLKPWM